MEKIESLRMNRIRELMSKKNITQKELEDLTGIQQSELSRIINDRKPGLRLSTAKRISKALGHPVDYIWPD